MNESVKQDLACRGHHLPLSLPQCWGAVESDLGPAGCVQPVPFCWAAALNCFHPSQTLPATISSSLPSANCSLLQGFWCQPAGQLPRDQLSALIQRLALLQVPLQAWQVSGEGVRVGGWARR